MTKPALLLRFAETAVGQIRAYLNAESERAGEMVAIAAQIELRRILEILARDPALGGAPTGPFESRPIYRFRLEAGSRRVAQVSYKYDTEHLDILQFASTPV